MAHELAHVKNRDILTGTIAATFVGRITRLLKWLARMFARMKTEVVCHPYL